MKKIILPVLLIVFNFSIMANETENRPSIDEMHEQKWSFLIKETGLTDEQANAVKPFFLKYEKASWELHEKSRSHFKEAREKINKKETVDYAQLNDLLINTELEQAKLLEEYHLKLKTLLSPDKLFIYYKAEHKFKRNLLHNVPKPPKGKK